MTATVANNLNRTITLAKGRRVGAGSLKKSVEATIIRADFTEAGTPFYTAMWVDAKSGKARFTCVSADELS